MQARLFCHHEYRALVGSWRDGLDARGQTCANQYASHDAKTRRLYARRLLVWHRMQAYKSERIAQRLSTIRAKIMSQDVGAAQPVSGDASGGDASGGDARLSGAVSAL